MGGATPHSSKGRAVRGLAREQHGAIARRQLLEIGYSPRAIEHRLTTGKLFAVRRGVYAVGRRELTREGRWMAAILRAGRGAVLSHQSAAALWRLADREDEITITIPSGRDCNDRTLWVHRARLPSADVRTRWRIPLTSPARTLLDLAHWASEDQLEHLINAADRADLIDPERLRDYVDGCSRMRGIPALRFVLDKSTFRYTASALERRFLPLARRAGLPVPETSVWIEGYEVDFLWPDLGLIVETDGLRYHRTTFQLERDSRRDQAHAAAGYRTLRFGHSQIQYNPDSVVGALRDVARLLCED